MVDEDVTLQATLERRFAASEQFTDALGQARSDGHVQFMQTNQALS